MRQLVPHHDQDFGIFNRSLNERRERQASVLWNKCYEKQNAPILKADLPLALKPIWEVE